MSESIQYDRRRFVGTAMMAIAATRLVAPPWRRLVPASRDDAIRQIGAPERNVGYAETGSSNGPPVILLYGWPRDSNGDLHVTPLATRGYRVIVPHVRGAAASDVMALIAALEIEKALVGGVDEGARTAETMAARWPQRLKAIVPASGSVEVTLAPTQRPLPLKEELAWWYQYYFLREGTG